MTDLPELLARSLRMRLPSPLTELSDDRLGSVRVLLKRDDLIHPVVTGNKWRKLKYLLPAAQEAGASTLLTFGGAYSNHVRALAAVGRHSGFRTIGVIRGEEHPYTELLAASVADGDAVAPCRSQLLPAQDLSRRGGRPAERAGQLPPRTRGRSSTVVAVITGSAAPAVERSGLQSPELIV